MIINLNLVTTYPVRWSTYKVLRDFIQNFYDSVKTDSWNEVFRHEYDPEKKQLSMWIKGTSFSYEWLLHIGASTKTNVEGNAGCFGEGFKIASLCAVRDCGWSVHLTSADWELDVVTVDHRIDGTSVRMLAYDLSRGDASDRSCLTLTNVSSSAYDIFLAACKGFYYPENPMLGKKLWEGKRGAVYTRSRNAYDSRLPYTGDFGRKGAVFCAYQLLGSNPYNLVVCDHTSRMNDRERDSLYTFQVVDVFKDVSYRMDARGAMGMLEEMRRNWNSQPKSHIDIHSWSPVISNLVNNIASDQEVCEEFRKKYPNLLVLPKITTVREQNRRMQARAWLKKQPVAYTLVQPSFSRLGYDTLEHRCEVCGGYTVNDNPDELEEKCFGILEKLTELLYADFFCFENMPERRIIRNSEAALHGQARILPRKGEEKRNAWGMKIKNQVYEVYLKSTIFRKDGFYDALSTYVHECTHTFGGDSSSAFSYALTIAMEILLTNTEALTAFRGVWMNLFDEKLIG